MKRRSDCIDRGILIPALLLMLMGALPAPAETVITRHVIGSGGGPAAAANQAVVTTIGQDVAGHAGGVLLFISSGFWHGGSSTSGVDDLEDLLPARFALARIAPNPFSPSATIRYDVPARGGAVRIDIYNVAGRRIKTLVDRESVPGRHVLVWDGATDAGRRVGAGVYFVAMSAPGYRQTERLICIR
ncbi:MAG: hypothetical protein GF355_04575 [Candidatus Eisenbacteria bacterium]|nr:hypothetical protein [Candidatus Eisenbacteria bacterium]